MKQMANFSGTMIRFLVYNDTRCRYLLGHGIRIEYCPSKKCQVTSIHLFDNNGEELPDGHYYLGDFTKPELIVLTETTQ